MDLPRAGVVPGGLKESRGREPRKSEEGGCAVATRLTMREDSEGKKGLGEQEEARGLEKRKREESGCE